MKAKSILIISLSMLLLTGFLVPISAQLDVGDVGIVSVETAELKESPRNFCETVRFLALNDEINIWDYNDSWYEVEIGDEMGWIKKDLVSSYNSVSTTTSDDLNVGDSATAGAIGIPEGESEKLFSISDLAGFNKEIYDNYLKSQGISNDSLIEEIHTLTDRYTVKTYNIFKDFRKVGELGEFIADERNDTFIQMDGDGIATQKSDMADSYSEALGRNDWKEEERHYLGLAMAQKFLSDREINSNEDLNRYVNAVGQTLAMASEKPTTYNGYRFILLNDDLPFTSSLPSGHVFISTGMLKSLDSEDELASILAVEIADIIHDVSLKESVEHRQEAFSVFADMVNNSTNKDDYLGMLETNMGNLSEIFGEIVSDTVSSLNDAVRKEPHTRSKVTAVVMLYDTGYNPNAILENGYTNTDGYPFDDNRAFVGEYEDNKSPIQSFIEELDLNNYSTNAERTDRFVSHKSILN